MENEENVNDLESRHPHHPKSRWCISRPKCTLCGECVDACPSKLLSIQDGFVIITTEKTCSECGECYAACGYRAIFFK